MNTTTHKSIYAKALGDDFARLHPKIQERFGFRSEDRVAHIGTGVMKTMTRGSLLAVPFLKFGTLRNLLFPEQGAEIEFTIENYAYTDRFGRETVTWYRTFNFPKRQRTFDATMIYSDERDQIVDYLGTHQHIAADLNCWVDDEGGINFESGEQRCYEGPLRFRFPRFLTGNAQVREWFDDATGEFQISVQVHNPILGHILGYRGSFTDQVIPIETQEDIPEAAIPVREQVQE